MSTSVHRSSLSSWHNTYPPYITHRSTIYTDMTLKYRDPNLTGCYAGTGGSTTFTLTTEDQWTFIQHGWTHFSAATRTFSNPCEEFFQMTSMPWQLVTPFAESPACASYAQDPDNEYKPLGVSQKWGDREVDGGTTFVCCGGCKLRAPEVQVLYWPVSFKTACSLNNKTEAPHTQLANQQNEIFTSNHVSQSTPLGFAVVDGSTLISPSFYLAFRGAVSVTNYCGPQGKTYYNRTIAVPSEGLSTLSFLSNRWDPIAVGGRTPETAVYDPEACRTYGVDSGSTVEAVWYGPGQDQRSAVSVSYHMGPPCNPILLPPKELTALDPDWEACTSWDYYGYYIRDNYFSIYDPPRVLTPAYTMANPSTISSSSTPQQTYPLPSPVGTMDPPDPKPTIPIGPAAIPNPVKGTPPKPASDDAGLGGFIIGPFLGYPTGTAIVSGAPLATASPASPDPHKSIDTDPDPFVNSDPNAIWKSNPLLLPYPSSGDPIGSAIPYVMVGETPYYLAPPRTITSSNVRVISRNPLGDSQPVWIGSSLFTANSAHLYVNGGKTISPGGPTVGIDGIAYSLDPAVTLPTDVIDAFSKISTDKNPALTIDGNTYTANPASQYRVDGQTLIPGGPKITVNDVVYSLPSPGLMLMSAGRTIPLSPQRSAPPEALAMLNSMGLVGSQKSKIFVVDGIPITSSLDKFTRGSATLAPGSPPVTISGHVFTETKGGTLMVDGRPVELPTGTLSNKFIVDGITMTGDSHLLAVGNTILTPGSPPLALSGHTLSLATGGALIVDGSTDPLPSLTSLATYVVDGCTFTGSPASLNMDGKILSPGSPAIQVDDHTFSLGLGGALIVDGRTTMLSPGLPSSSPASHAINSDDPTSVQNFSSVNGTNPLVFTGMVKRHEAAEFLVFMLVLAGLVSIV